MLLHGGIFADTACGSMRLFVVWRIVERMGRRHRLAADTACAGMRAVVVGVEILEIWPAQSCSGMSGALVWPQSVQTPLSSK